MYAQLPDYSLEEGGLMYATTSRKVRNDFIRKVYSLLTVQLLVTTVIAAPFTLMDESVILPWMMRNMWVMWLSMGVSFMVMITFACNPDLMQQVPINYFLLGLFTITEGLCIGFVSALYTTQSVVLAFGIVTVVTLALTVFAVMTDIDLTKSAFPYLLAGTVVLIVAGLVLMVFPSETGLVIYSAVGALLFSVYLVFDTQMIIGGKHRTNQFSVDDYVPATIALYLDIVQLFLYFLQLFGDRRDLSMVVNNVPKFVQQKMADKRRERKRTTAGTDIVKEKSFSGFESAKKKFQHKHSAQVVREEATKQREQKQAEAAEKRKQEGKLFRKQNDRGQPHLGSQLEIMLKRFNK